MRWLLPLFIKILSLLLGMCRVAFPCSVEISALPGESHVHGSSGRQQVPHHVLPFLCSGDTHNSQGGCSLHLGDGDVEQSPLADSHGICSMEKK